MDLAQTSATVFSLVADLPAPRGGGAAAGARLDSVQLEHAGQAFACGLHWIGPCGARLRSDTPVPAQQPLSLLLDGMEPISGRSLWCDGDENGIAFEAPLDVLGLVARNLARATVGDRRLPRIELRQTVGVHCNGMIEQLAMHNISQGGIGVEAARLEVEEKVGLTFDGLRPLDGTVRWVRGGAAGIAFVEELGWQTLFPWLRGLQHAPQSARPRPLLGGLLRDGLALRLDAPGRVREGVRWWNCRVHAVTARQVEFEAAHGFSPGASLWIALPDIGGGPARVVRTSHGRTLADFRMPLRDQDLRTLAATIPSD